MTGARPSAPFEGTTAVVTGVGHAGQLGEAVAREFARRGAHVAIIDRDSANADALATSMREDRLDVTAFGCDLTDAGATSAVLAKIGAASGGRIRALANVAGGFAMSGPVEESDPAVLQRQLSINLGSAYGATRAAIPFLRAAGGGSIVYMVSAAILPGGKSAGMAAYAASKAGVAALMRTVAQEEKSHHIRANALAPTAIRTTANVGSMGDKFPYVEREAVAAVIAFLCSDEAVNITGQVIELA